MIWESDHRRRKIAQALLVPSLLSALILLLCNRASLVVTAFRLECCSLATVHILNRISPLDSALRSAPMMLRRRLRRKWQFSSVAIVFMCADLSCAAVFRCARRKVGGANYTEARETDVINETTTSKHRHFRRNRRRSISCADDKATQ